MKQETLAWTLRYKLGLTGTKLGCDRAECGACTVLIDDVPHYSCSVLTHTVREQESPDHRRAGQRRRQRCIRCSRASSTSRDSSARSACPASSWRRSDILKTNPNPTPVGTGARHFREPVPLPGLRQDPHRHDARRREHEEGEPCLAQRASPLNKSYGAKYKLIGKDYTTPDLYAKVTGKAKYAEDFRADGMLFCKLLLSPVPHARVKHLDLEQGAGHARGQGDSHAGRSSRARPTA